MPPGEQIAFEPALALVLAEHFHNAAVGGHVVVAGQDVAGELAVGDLEHGIPAIRGRLVRAEDAEVAGLGVELDDVAENAPWTRVASACTAPGWGPRRHSRRSRAAASP